MNMEYRDALASLVDGTSIDSPEAIVDLTGILGGVPSTCASPRLSMSARRATDHTRSASSSGMLGAQDAEQTIAKAIREGGRS